MTKVAPLGSTSLMAGFALVQACRLGGPGLARAVLLRMILNLATPDFSPEEELIL